MGTYLGNIDSVSYERVTTGITDSYGVTTSIWDVAPGEENYWTFVLCSARGQGASGDFGGNWYWNFYFETQNRYSGAWVIQKLMALTSPTVPTRTGNIYRPVNSTDAIPAPIIYRLGPGDRVRLTTQHQINGHISFVWVKNNRPTNLWTLY